MAQPAAPRPRLPAVDPWEQPERLQRELEAIGFYLSAHPLDDYATALERLGVDSKQLLVEALTDRDPIYRESTPEGAAGNRRVEIFQEFR